MIVGFNSSEYNASEGDDLEIIVALLFGKLRDAIVLSLAFSPPTDGKHTHTHTHTHTFQQKHTLNTHVQLNRSIKST